MKCQERGKEYELKRGEERKNPLERERERDQMKIEGNERGTINFRRIKIK